MEDSVFRFFTSYVNFFYADSEDIFADKELNSFWECVDLRGNLGSPWKYGLPDLNRESLIDYLTHMAFNVTAWHEHVGTIVHYVLPSQGAHMGMGLKIRPGKEEADVQACTVILSCTPHERGNNGCDVQYCFCLQGCGSKPWSSRIYRYG